MNSRDRAWVFLSFPCSIDGKAGFKDRPKIGQLAKANSLPEVLDFAIQREMDSVLYYQELKKFVGAVYANAIDLIIDEERMHFAFLSKLRRGVTGP